MSEIELAEGADQNGFAQMLADLLRQNLEGKPHKRKALDAMDGAVALVADDADVALTMVFGGGKVVLHDGIKGVPDIAVRGSSEILMAMSNMPLTRRLALPIPTDRGTLEVLRSMVKATRSGDLRIYGMLGSFGLLNRLTQVMSVNG